MEFNRIIVKSNGEGMEKALRMAELAASACDLPRRSALQLRLLSEEMMGILRSITHETEATYWITEKDRQFALHLATDTAMRSDKRSELLSVATSGRNEAARGVTGKLRSLFEAAMDPDADDMPSLLSMGLSSMASPGSVWLSPVSVDWSMNAYKQGVEESAPQDSEAAEAWDELEKSVVSRLADEVTVAIRGQNVEMVIYKAFKGK